MKIFHFILLSYLSYIKLVRSTQLNDLIQSKIKYKRDNLWIPKPETTWNWILSVANKEIKSDTSVDVLDIDLFNNSKETIDSLKKEGHHIICYFSVGTFEKWRPDADRFLKVDGLVRDKMEEWEGENYLDITKPELKPIMSDRFDLAKEKGCDAVEADNIDTYESKVVKKWEKPITVEDQIAYDIWLTEEAHARGLSIAMKNDIENIKILLDYFDFAVNEECYDYDECGEYVDTFIKQNKAVFVAAYGDRCNEKFLKKLEKNTKGKNLSIIIKNMDLDQDYVAFDPDHYNYDDICKTGQTSTNTTINDDNSSKDNTKEDQNQSQEKSDTKEEKLEQGEIEDSEKYVENEEGNHNSSSSTKKMKMLSQFTYLLTILSIFFLIQS